MQELEILKEKTGDKELNELNLFLINNTNFSEKQNSEFVKILDKVLESKR